MNITIADTAFNQDGSVPTFTLSMAIQSQSALSHTALMDLERKYSIVLQERYSKRYGKKYYEKFFHSIARHLKITVFPSDHEKY
jgi:hypothetical protein